MYHSNSLVWILRHNKQLHRVTTDPSELALKKKSTALHSSSISVKRFWHSGLLHKMSRVLQSTVLVLQTRTLNIITSLFTTMMHPHPPPVTIGVPQGKVLGFFLYLLYILDIPSILKVKIATFADDYSYSCTT